MQLAKAPIHVVEAVALVVAARLWVPLLHGEHTVVVGSDSRPVVDSVMFGRAKDEALQAATRLLWFLHAVHDVHLIVRYVNTKVNPSDPLSRLDKEEVGRLLAEDWQLVVLDQDIFSLDEADTMAAVVSAKPAQSPPIISG